VATSRGQGVLLADGGNATMPIVISEAAMNAANPYGASVFWRTAASKCDGDGLGKPLSPCHRIITDSA